MWKSTPGTTWNEDQILLSLLEKIWPKSITMTDSSVLCSETTDSPNDGCWLPKTSCRVPVDHIFGMLLMSLDVWWLFQWTVLPLSYLFPMMLKETEKVSHLKTWGWWRYCVASASGDEQTLWTLVEPLPQPLQPSQTGKSTAFLFQMTFISSFSYLFIRYFIVFAWMSLFHLLKSINSTARVCTHIQTDILLKNGMSRGDCLCSLTAAVCCSRVSRRSVRTDINDHVSLFVPQRDFWPRSAVTRVWHPTDPAVTSRGRKWRLRFADAEYRGAAVASACRRLPRKRKGGCTIPVSRVAAVRGFTSQ